MDYSSEENRILASVVTTCATVALPVVSPDATLLNTRMFFEFPNNEEKEVHTRPAVDSAFNHVQWVLELTETVGVLRISTGNWTAVCAPLPKDCPTKGHSPLVPPTCQ
jgi:hypothetical protein